MDFYAKRSALEPELSRLQGVLSKKPVIPIASHVLIRSEAGHKVELATTNLDTSMICTILADQIAEQGSMCLPARQFYDLVKLLPEGIIHITKETEKQVLVTTGRTKFRIPDADPDQFPTLVKPTKAPNLSFSAKTLRTMIKSVEFAIAPEEDVRFMLRGVKFESDMNGTRMAAGDGHRLAVATTGVEGIQMDDLDVLIPHKALEDFEKLISDYDGPVKIATEENTIFFQAGERILTSRMLSGAFPSFEKIVAKVQSEVKDIMFQSPELTAALRRASLAADSQSQAITFGFDSRELVMSAETAKSGLSEEALAIDYTGEPFKMNLNAKYLLDFLASNSGQVLLGVSDNASAICLRATKEGIASVCIVMPMATQAE